jgi:hypothetical protein
MTKFQVGDKVKVNAPPVNWPACTKFTLLGAECIVGLWVDWPEAMDPYVASSLPQALSKGKATNAKINKPMMDFFIFPLLFNCDFLDVRVVVL